ncbi:type II toxin-antitoxin system RelE/ParE family toxin [Sphingosinicella terrae]|uniref:type II toxin-antitoxin system RelE/ParE family toxin n=1 Tax=Sphingosinicella terrae TaxID=2172047 RepID=UPI000E0CE397|nr:type II toxin-antitoxin system RelE/ParE family toxin [Sphingosinicella terrae]
MTAKAVEASKLALRDLEEAAEYYRREAGGDVALRFIEAAEAAFTAISERPGSGSSRFAHELNIPGLRSRRTGRFPFLVFYSEHESHVRVLRVLHGQRDIPAWMTDGD